MTTRAESHADTDAGTVRESRRVVRRALERHAVGRENAMSGRELADLVPIAYTTTRDVVAELRDDPDGPPIGNCGDGYYVIASGAELDEWVEKKKDEMATIRERIEANARAFNRREYGDG